MYNFFRLTKQKVILSTFLFLLFFVFPLIVVSVGLMPDRYEKTILRPSSIDTIASILSEFISFISTPLSKLMSILPYNLEWKPFITYSNNFSLLSNVVLGIYLIILIYLISCILLALKDKLNNKINKKELIIWLIISFFIAPSPIYGCFDSCGTPKVLPFFIAFLPLMVFALFNLLTWLWHLLFMILFMLIFHPFIKSILQIKIKNINSLNKGKKALFIILLIIIKGFIIVLAYILYSLLVYWLWSLLPNWKAEQFLGNQPWAPS